MDNLLQRQGVISTNMENLNEKTPVGITNIPTGVLVMRFLVQTALINYVNADHLG